MPLGQGMSGRWTIRRCGHALFFVFLLTSTLSISKAPLSRPLSLSFPIIPSRYHTLNTCLLGILTTPSADCTRLCIVPILFQSTHPQVHCPQLRSSTLRPSFSTLSPEITLTSIDHARTLHSVVFDLVVTPVAPGSCSGTDKHRFSS